MLRSAIPIGTAVTACPTAAHVDHQRPRQPADGKTAEQQHDALAEQNLSEQQRPARLASTVGDAAEQDAGGFEHGNEQRHVGFIRDIALREIGETHGKGEHTDRAVMRGNRARVVAVESAGVAQQGKRDQRQPPHAQRGGHLRHDGPRGMARQFDAALDANREQQVNRQRLIEHARQFEVGAQPPRREAEHEKIDNRIHARLPARFRAPQQARDDARRNQRHHHAEGEKDRDFVDIEQQHLRADEHQHKRQPVRQQMEAVGHVG